MKRIGKLRRAVALAALLALTACGGVRPRPRRQQGPVSRCA